MGYFMKKLFQFILCLFISFSVYATNVQLRILETSDIHMNLLNYDYYQDKITDEFGLAKTVSLIKQSRLSVANSILIDNGDILQGNPLGDYVAKVHPLKVGEVHPAYKVLNELDYSVGNLGNHEFNYGLPFLLSSIKTANFPYINSNIINLKTNKPLFTPYVILNKQVIDETGKSQIIKIGVIGFVPPQIMQWDRANLEGKVKVLDIVDTAKKYIPQMQAQGADIIIAVPHSGFEKGDTAKFAENAVAGLSKVAGINVILFGHAHAEFPSVNFANYPGVNLESGTINGVAAVMPGRWGDHLGVVDLNLTQKVINGKSKWVIANQHAYLESIYNKEQKKALVMSDPMVMQLIESEHLATLDYVRKKVTTTSVPIYSYFSLVEPSASEEIVQQAQIWYAKNAIQGTEYENIPVLSAAAPFKAGGRMGWSYYTDVVAGDVAIKNIADLYVYPNTIKILKVNGHDIREWLERSAGQFNTVDTSSKLPQYIVNMAYPTYNFDNLSGGVAYKVDLTQDNRYAIDGKLINPNSHRIINLTYNGKLITDNMEFLVVTNNYRASGGGNFPQINASKIIVDAQDENREIVARYLASHNNIALSKLNNWQIAPIANTQLYFNTGSGSVKYLNQHPEFKLVKENIDGSVTLQLMD